MYYGNMYKFGSSNRGYYGHCSRLKQSVLRKNVAPCKDCADRHVGCHSKCSKYVEWKKEIEAKQHELYKKADTTIQADRQALIRHKASANMRNFGKTYIDSKPNN